MNFLHQPFSKVEFDTIYIRDRIGGGQRLKGVVLENFGAISDAISVLLYSEIQETFEFRLDIQKQDSVFGRAFFELKKSATGQIRH